MHVALAGGRTFTEHALERRNRSRDRAPAQTHAFPPADREGAGEGGWAQGPPLTCCSRTPLGNTHRAGWPGLERLCTNSIPCWSVSFLTRYTRYQSFPARVQKSSTCRRYCRRSSAISAEASGAGGGECGGLRLRDSVGQTAQSPLLGTQRKKRTEKKGPWDIPALLRAGFPYFLNF